MHTPELEHVIAVSVGMDNVAQAAQISYEGGRRLYTPRENCRLETDPAAFYGELAELVVAAAQPEPPDGIIIGLHAKLHERPGDNTRWQQEVTESRHTIDNGRPDFPAERLAEASASFADLLQRDVLLRVTTQRELVGHAGASWFRGYTIPRIAAVDLTTSPTGAEMQRDDFGIYDQVSEGFDPDGLDPVLLGALQTLQEGAQLPYTEAMKLQRSTVPVLGDWLTALAIGAKTRGTAGMVINLDMNGHVRDELMTHCEEVAGETPLPQLHIIQSEGLWGPFRLRGAHDALAHYVIRQREGQLQALREKFGRLTPVASEIAS